MTELKIDKPLCAYYRSGFCKKGLPGTVCDPVGCQARYICPYDCSKCQLEQFCDKTMSKEYIKESSKDCRHYNNEACGVSLSDHSECIGKDICGAYEPTPESEQRISVEHLRDILERCVNIGYINEYGLRRIIEIVKKEV